MLLVPKLKRLIPSPMDYPHHAQLPNACCAKAHPQLHDKTATAKRKWHKDCKLSRSVLRTSATAQIPLKSWEISHIYNVLRNIREAPQHPQHFSFESPCNTCHIFKTCNICSILKALQHLQYFEKFRNTCNLSNIF